MSSPIETKLRVFFPVFLQSVFNTNKKLSELNIRIT